MTAPPVRGRKRAIVAGIDDYSNAGLDSLLFCGADASAVAETLEGMGYETELFLDEAATKASILRALTEEIDTDDLETLVFFFAGHGGVTELAPVLVTSDATPFGEGVFLPDLVKVVTRIAKQGANVVSLLDCCGSGAIELPGAALVRDPITDEKVSSAFERGTGSRAVLAACLADEESEELLALGHGRFTYHLLKGLRGDAADRKGQITPNTLFEYIAPHLERANGQKPAYYASVAGTVAIASGFPPSSGPIVKEEEFTEIEQTAAQLLADYKREATDHDSSDWNESGFQDAARLLGQAIAWMEREAERHAGLSDRKEFKATYEGAQRLAQFLGALGPGLHLSEGRVDKPVGSGAFGTVWKVVDSEHSRTLAYKVYHSNELADTAKKSRFKHGFRAMEKLNHKRVVKVTRYTDVPVGFFMDYIDGPNLRDANPAKAMEVPDTLRLLIEISEAVAHAHARGVVHRDIKPENIVCTYSEDGTRLDPYLTDFDLAWTSTTSQVTRDGIGNYLYAAPEQLMYFTQKAVSGFYPTLDVFALGQVAYFCATGSDPNPTHRDQNIENLGRRLADWPSGGAAGSFMELYRNCSEEKPKDRYQSVEALIQQLFEVERLARPDALEGTMSIGKLLSEVVFAFTGTPREVASDEEPTFLSLSGQSHVNLSVSAMRSGRVHVTAHIAPATNISLEGRTNESVRRKLNTRVKKAIEGFPTVSWRHGNKGAFSIYIELDDVSVDGEGLRQLCSVLTTVLQVIEGAH